MWTRKLTQIGGLTVVGDYLIYRDSQNVGRIILTADVGGEKFWNWSTLVHPSESGRADSIGEAQEALRHAVRRHWPDDAGEVKRLGTQFMDL